MSKKRSLEDEKGNVSDSDEPPAKKAKMSNKKDKDPEKDEESKAECKSECGRSVNPGVTRSGKPFDTCCRDCAVSTRPADYRPHTEVCNQRFIDQERKKFNDSGNKDDPLSKLQNEIAILIKVNKMELVSAGTCDWTVTNVIKQKPTSVEYISLLKNIINDCFESSLGAQANVKNTEILPAIVSYCFDMRLPIMLESVLKSPHKRDEDMRNSLNDEDCNVLKTVSVKFNIGGNDNGDDKDSENENSNKKNKESGDEKTDEKNEFFKFANNFLYETSIDGLIHICDIRKDIETSKEECKAEKKKKIYYNYSTFDEIMCCGEDQEENVAKIEKKIKNFMINDDPNSKLYAFWTLSFEHTIDEMQEEFEGLLDEDDDDEDNNNGGNNDNDDEEEEDEDVTEAEKEKKKRFKDRDRYWLEFEHNAWVVLDSPKYDSLLVFYGWSMEG